MLDIQVNGGKGLLFNKIKTLEEFLKIELSFLKESQCFIIPTFITDSDENLKSFIKLVKERICLNEKEYIINNNKIILPKLFGVHIEGPFITNKGTHPKKYLKEFNEFNVGKFIEIIKPLENLKIYLTIAPELLLQNFKESHSLLKKLKNKFNIVISAGHTNITKNDFSNLQNKLGVDEIKMLTHFHNAMLEGHFVGNSDGIPSYLLENNYSGYFGMVADGHHTSKGELLPTLLNYYDKVCIVSDGTAPSCCKIRNNESLFEMGGNVSMVEQKNNKLPIFFWTDFTKNKDFYEKDLNKLYEYYINGEYGYKTLAGSAVNLKESYNFLKDLDIKDEIKKSNSNPKAKKLLEIGLKKNNLQENDIKDFINKNLDKMFFENPIKALDIDSDIYNYIFKDNKLFKNDKIFLDFSFDFGDFLKQVTPNQKKLKNKLLNYLKKNFIK